MEKVKTNNKKPIVTMVSTNNNLPEKMLQHFGGLQKVVNWIAEDKKEARHIVEKTIKEIREDWRKREESSLRYRKLRGEISEEEIKNHKFDEWTKEWGGNKCYLYLGESPAQAVSKFVYEFYIIEPLDNTENIFDGINKRWE